MPDVTLQDSTFARLQGHAKPLVDTIDTVMNRALDALDREMAGSSGPVAGQPPEAERRIDPRALPDLTHTKVLEASIEGERLDKANWNVMLVDLLRRVMRRVQNYEKLRQVCPVNMVNGRKTDEGYSHLADIDVSFQGQDANSACRLVVTAAQQLGIAVDIAFMWRHKEGAAYPGERARLQLAGASVQASSTRRSA